MQYFQNRGKLKNVLNYQCRLLSNSGTITQKQHTSVAFVSRQSQNTWEVEEDTWSVPSQGLEFTFLLSSNHPLTPSQAEITAGNLNSQQIQQLYDT